MAKPNLGSEESAAIADVLASGWVTQGPRVTEFERGFAEYCGSDFAVATSSCTTALHLALLSVGVKPGDVVICPSLSFIATANSIRHCGAEPYFVDVRAEDLNLDPEALSRAIEKDFVAREGGMHLKEPAHFRRSPSPWLRLDEQFCGRLGAILCVHQIGLPAPMTELLALTRRINVPIIEDAACAIGSKLQTSADRWHFVGQALGEAACFSFHPRKLVVTGDGGMITTQNPSVYSFCRLNRQHGMSVNDLERHRTDQVIFESYESAGYNYRMTDLQAALGLVQLRKLDAMIEQRRHLGDRYREQLADASAVRVLNPPASVYWNHQSFQVQLTGAPDLRKVITALKSRGVDTRRGIMCAHHELPYRGFWELDMACLAHSNELRATGLILPLHHELDDKDVDYICAELRRALQ